MKIYIVILVTVVISCRSGKSFFNSLNAQNHEIQKEAIENSKYGVKNYFVVNIEGGRLGITTSICLCEMLLPDQQKGGDLVCYKKINEFFVNKATIPKEQVLFNPNLSILESELVQDYMAIGIQGILTKSYNKDCLPRFHGVFSQNAEQASALILLGVNLVQDDFSGQHFHLSDKSAEKYCLN